MLASAALFLLAAASGCRASELLAGASSAGITPDRPVALQGQMNTRISTGVRSPVTATALALESTQNGQVLDQALLVSCDLVGIDRAVLDRVRALLKHRLPGFDGRKLVLSATHTHTAPVYEEGRYLIPKVKLRPTRYAKLWV